MGNLRIHGRPVTDAQIAAACDLSDLQIIERVQSVIRKPSAYQMDIFRFFLENLRLYMQGKPNVINLLVRATAGSGKTTTIVGLAYLIPSYMSAIFLAFNKPIAEELGKRLPRHVWAKTLNSAGWNFCKKFCDTQVGYTIGNLDLTNPGKLGSLLRKMYTYKEIKEYYSDVIWLVGMCQSLGIVPTDPATYGEYTYGDLSYVAPNGLDDSDATFDMLLSTYDRRIARMNRPKVYRIARELLIKSITTFDCITYDEQKYLPVVLRDKGKPLSWRKFDLVIIDEVQDANTVDAEVVDLLRRMNGMVVGVGDPRQSIYGFRGADTRAMEKFGKRFNCKELPLTVSYRCARNIVEYAKSIYPEIEAAPGAPEGAIRTIGEYDGNLFQPNGDDMVVCRNNAPIVNFAYDLIIRRIPVFVKGRDIGKGIIALIDKMNAFDVESLVSALNIWREQQVSIALDDNPDDTSALQSINDKVETIMVFVRHNVDGRLDTLKYEIGELFSVRTKEKDDEKLMNGKVVLSTIHKAKGLEAERVFFLDVELMFPHWLAEGGWQEEQESNLMFVAITRPKTELNFITSDKLL